MEIMNHPGIHLADKNLSLVNRKFRANALPGSCGMYQLEMTKSLKIRGMHDEQQC